MRTIKACTAIMCLLIFATCKKNATLSPNELKVFITHHAIVGIKAIRLSNGKFVAAMQESDNKNYCLLIEVDTTGKEIWRREFGSDLQTITDIQPTLDSGMVITSFNATTQLQFFVTCLATDGSTKWTSNYAYTTTDSSLVQSVVLGIGTDNSSNILVGVC